ncbi:MAG: hypothetical protein RL556_757, partial [Actinomycetota bacterium]
PIYFITAIGAFVPPYGLLPGLTFDFIVSLSIIFCFAFARIFSPKNVVIASIYTVFVVSIAAYLGGTAAMMILSIRLNDEYLVSMIGNGAWILELTITGALIMAAFRSHLEIERELVQLVGADAASKNKELLSAQIANRELAQYLHGHVQNQLLASALRLEQAENSNNEMEMRKELEAVDKLLEEAPKGIRSGSSGSLTHELRSIERLWTGLLEVQIEVDETCEKLDLGPNMIHDFTQAVNESITNALRHGFASRVAVSVRAKSGNIELVCSDNGTGPRSGGAGLGSALYSSLAGTRWSLEPAIGGGSVLTVKVKV